MNSVHAPITSHSQNAQRRRQHGEEHRHGDADAADGKLFIQVESLHLEGADRLAESALCHSAT